MKFVVVNRYLLFTILVHISFDKYVVEILEVAYLLYSSNANFRMHIIFNLFYLHYLGVVLVQVHSFRFLPLQYLRFSGMFVASARFRQILQQHLQMVIRLHSFCITYYQYLRWRFARLDNLLKYATQQRTLASILVTVIFLQLMLETLCCLS